MECFSPEIYKQNLFNINGNNLNENQIYISRNSNDRNKIHL